MRSGVRIGLAIAFVVGDFIAFMAPLGSVVIAYCMIARPAWWLNWWKEVYTDA